MTTTQQKREHFSSQHQVGIELIKEGLAEKVASLLKIKDLTSLLDNQFSEKLTNQGKAIVSNGLNEEALSATEAEIRKAFRKPYDEALAIGETELSQGTDPKIAAHKAQILFKQSLENAKIEEILFQYFLQQLASQGQTFTEQDKPHLREVFYQYMDKTAKMHSDSLNDFQSLESVKARIQLHDENSKSNSNASMTAQVLTNNLNTGTKVEPKVGYKIDIDNLRKQLKYTLANLKPGEKINIDVTMPERADLEKRIAEIGFQYRTPLLALLLLLFIQLHMLKKDDTTRVLKAVKDLAEKDGLRINPKDINLKMSVTGNDGRKQTVLEGPLAEPLAQELNKSIAKINAQLAPKPVPSQKRKAEDDNENKEMDRDTSRSPIPGLHLMR